MDVTDIVNYNIDVLNQNTPTSSFFHLDRNDPLAGFPFDASMISGHAFPPVCTRAVCPPGCIPALTHPLLDGLSLRLVLGSHLAQYLRHQLEEHKGYTCTVGISTNKLISKLVGNLNKPKGQTTLLPPYEHSTETGDSNITRFLDAHNIGELPGIGFVCIFGPLVASFDSFADRKICHEGLTRSTCLTNRPLSKSGVTDYAFIEQKTAQIIRQHVLNRAADFQTGLVYGKDCFLDQPAVGTLLELDIHAQGASGRHLQYCLLFRSITSRRNC